MTVLTVARYLWAAPATCVGLVAAGVALASGGRARVVDGVIEVHGGRLAAAVDRLPAGARFVAITIGHVILGTAPEVLAVVRRHEHAHVRQYERWGPLFFPLYAGASLVAWLCARHPYWHNHFERQARHAAEAEEEVIHGRSQDEGDAGECRRLPAGDVG